MPRAFKYSPYLALSLILRFAISKKLKPEYFLNSEMESGFEKRGRRISFRRKPADFVDYGEWEHWSMEWSGIKEIEEI